MTQVGLVMVTIENTGTEDIEIVGDASDTICDGKSLTIKPNKTVYFTSDGQSTWSEADEDTNEDAQFAEKLEPEVAKWDLEEADE